MQLCIENKNVTPNPGESLLDLIKREGLDADTLSTKPLAAKIAGEVFTLNYVPVREKEIGADGERIRNAMSASKGEVRLLRYADGSGKEVYTRTACFLTFLALKKLYPISVAKISCTIGNSVYISMENCPDFSVDDLKAEMSELIIKDFPLIRRRVSLADAVLHFSQNGQKDKADLLRWRNAEYFDEYFYQDFSDYFYRNVTVDFLVSCSRIDQLRHEKTYIIC